MLARPKVETTQTHMISNKILWPGIKPRKGNLRLRDQSCLKIIIKTSQVLSGVLLRCRSRLALNQWTIAVLDGIASKYINQRLCLRADIVNESLRIQGLSSITSR